MKKIVMSILFPALVAVAFSCGSKEETAVPQISGVATDYEGNKVVAGKPVTLVGTNFSPKASDNKILYGVGMNVTSLDVTEASEDRLVFVAPVVSSTQLRIRVAVKGLESNSVVLEFDNSLDEGPEVDLSDLLNNAVKVTVREGVEWISFHGLWEGSIRNINILRTTLNEHNSLGIYHEYGADDDFITKKCEYLDALVGTNGPMRCCHYVRVNGKTMRVANEQDPWICNCAMTIDNGVPDIVKVKDNYDSAKLPNQNIGTAGPLLVYEGRIQEYPQWAGEEFIITDHPRTAFGITKDQKTVIQVAVDGRWVSGPVEQRAIGLETPLLAKLMKGLGCWKALNFDGGGGTAMWIYGHGVNGIVNHPCDAPMNWDNPTLRTSGSAVYIYSDLK